MVLTRDFMPFILPRDASKLSKTRLARPNQSRSKITSTLTSKMKCIALNKLCNAARARVRVRVARKKWIVDEANGPTCLNNLRNRRDPGLRPRYIIPLARVCVTVARVRANITGTGRP